MTLNKDEKYFSYLNFINLIGINRKGGFGALGRGKNLISIGGRGDQRFTLCCCAELEQFLKFVFLVEVDV